MHVLCPMVDTRCALLPGKPFPAEKENDTSTYADLTLASEFRQYFGESSLAVLLNLLGRCGRGDWEASPGGLFVC